MLNLFIAVVQANFREVKDTSGFEWLNGEKNKEDETKKPEEQTEDFQ